MTPGEINTLAEEHFANPSVRMAQKKLAYEVTKLVHGVETTDRIVDITTTLFGGGDSNIYELLGDTDKLDILAHEIPVVGIDQSIVAVLVSSQVASSNGEALRLIKQGAVSVNGQKIDADQTVRETSLVKKGKNSFILVR
jgi:tyrosyl-tRNA synthetase